MRTPLLILLGLLVGGLALYRTKPAQRPRTALVFTVVWLAVTIWNLLTGLSHGYTFAEELPIQAAIFLIPVGFAWLVVRLRGTR